MEQIENGTPLIVVCVVTLWALSLLLFPTILITLTPLPPPFPTLPLIAGYEHPLSTYSPELPPTL